MQKVLFIMLGNTYVTFQVERPRGTAIKSAFLFDILLACPSLAEEFPHTPKNGMQNIVSDKNCNKTGETKKCFKPDFFFI